MKNKILFTLNSHRTYNNALSKKFVHELSDKRNISYSDSEFVMYYSDDLKIVIDSLLSVYISLEHSQDSLDNLIRKVKNEYEFLCTLNERFDTNTTIEISISKGFFPLEKSKFVFNDMTDVLFLTV